MRDRPWILLGLAIFLAVFTTPFWHAFAHTPAMIQPPDLQLPAAGKQCVAPVAYMRTSHMRLLLDWRESVVRHGERTFVSLDHHTYQKSLTKTCWGCHNREGFCDRCHAYSGVSTPYCWTCHNQPQANIAWRIAP